MKKTRRILGLGLAAAMMMSGAAGLADGVVLNDEGVTPIVKEGDVTLKIAVTQSADVVDYNNGNWLTDHLAEMLGGKIEVDVWPSTDAETKLTLMVTSGNELPDVLTFGATTWSTAIPTPTRVRCSIWTSISPRAAAIPPRSISAAKKPEWTQAPC